MPTAPQASVPALPAPTKGAGSAGAPGKGNETMNQQQQVIAMARNRLLGWARACESVASKGQEPRPVEWHNRDLLNQAEYYRELASELEKALTA